MVPDDATDRVTPTLAAASPIPRGGAASAARPSREAASAAPISREATPASREAASSTPSSGEAAPPPADGAAPAASLEARAAAAAARSVAKGAGERDVLSSTDPVEYDFWRRTSFGVYLAPRSLAYPGGAVPLVFHFHMGHLADKEWREAGGGAVVVSVTWGEGAARYRAPLEDSGRFQAMIDEVMLLLRARSGDARLHAARVSLFAWSAGYASVQTLLAQGYGARVDAVVLLDGLHTDYTRPRRKRQLEVEPLAPFVAFARAAAAGKKLFIVTHSAIAPFDYASTTETSAYLSGALGGEDIGNFHVRGLPGEDAAAHIAHLHLVGDVIREFVDPWWKRDEGRLH